MALLLSQGLHDLQEALVVVAGAELLAERVTERLVRRTPLLGRGEELFRVRVVHLALVVAAHLALLPVLGGEHKAVPVVQEGLIGVRQQGGR